jgi:NADH-quinone oxidoreductase subunit J
MRAVWPLLLYYLLPLVGLWSLRRSDRISRTVTATSWFLAAVALGVIVGDAGGFGTIAFYLLSLLAVATAFLVVTGTNPIYGALSLIGTFLGIAGVFVVLQSEFFGIVQVILYAGAILVLYLFVVMMVDLPKETAAQARFGLKGGVAITTGLGLLALVVTALAPLGARVAPAAAATDAYSVQAVGNALFGRYLVPFEVASLLLLVALVGAIVLCARERES